MVEPAAQPSLRRHWTLEPGVTFLNHGSFGACPAAVLEVQAELRARLEREPVRFFDRELEPLLDAARERLGAFVGARAQDIGWVPNATSAVSTVLRSLELGPGDEVLTTDHEYNAVLNALHQTVSRSGARLAVARLPLPLPSADDAQAALLEAAGPRTRLVVLSHVTSATALRLPVERVVPALAERGIDTLVDGAHAPGMVPLALDDLGAAYYAGNCHKWLCAPKGAGFLYVRPDRQAGIRPLVISHGANSARRDRSRLLLELDWTGTHDPTAFLSVPAAIDFLADLLPDGWPALMAANHALVRRGRDALLEVVGGQPCAPDHLLGSMAAVELPSDLPPRPPPPPADHPADAALPPDPLHQRLLAEHAIEVPVYAWPGRPSLGRPRRLLRLSAQAYNEMADYQRLAAALRELTVT